MKHLQLVAGRIYNLLKKEAAYSPNTQHLEDFRAAQKLERSLDRRARRRPTVQGRFAPASAAKRGTGGSLSGLRSTPAPSQVSCESTRSAPLCVAAIPTGRKPILGPPTAWRPLPSLLTVLIAEDRLTEIPGVGEAIADIITKLHKTGTHPSLEKLRKEIPEGVLEMLAVPGLRPEKVLRLYKDLGIASLVELEAAAKDDRIKKAKGLGAALQTKILQNLAIAKSGEGRLHLHRAAALLAHAKDSLRKARPELKRVTIAGDFRRGCELVGDLTIVAEAAKADKTSKASAADGLQIRLSDRKHFGAALLFATGSAAHIEQLQALAAEKGMRLESRRLAQGSHPDRRRRGRDLLAPSACPSSILNYGRGAARSNWL